MPGDMKVLLVGAGPMAVAYGAVLNALGVSWTVVGRGAASAAKFEAATGMRPVLGGLASYLESCPRPLDLAVIVALPIPELAGAAQILAEAGVGRILLEKPAGLTVTEVDAVAQAAARTGVQIFVAYNRRFYASVYAARELIAQDGGVTSFHMEFTELVDRILASNKDRTVLSNWFLANSTHVIDLAFYLCGQPTQVTGITAGELDWHSAGAVFVGHGRTRAGAVFSWHADWSSAGRWGIDIRTPRRRLLLQPLETLAVQDKGSFSLAPHAIADELDRRYKPGLYREVEAFLSKDPTSTALPAIADHFETVRRWFSVICPAVTSLAPLSAAEAG